MTEKHTAADALALSAALAAKARQLSLGLESGAADLLELVMPTTAELLHWWFGQDMVDARGGLNFHAGQRQAILNAIVAHEVLGAASLLIWQLRNKNAALAEGVDDARFTRHFMVVAPRLRPAAQVSLQGNLLS